jgi:hypothetical protein
MTFILPKPLKGIPYPFVLVCEGMGDAGFLEVLLKHLKIDNCCVGCPSDETAHGSGIDAIPQYLKGIAVEATRAGAKIDGIAVVVDANGMADQRFNSVAQAFVDAKFPAPAAPFAINQGPPRNGIFLMPGNGKAGTLDNLLLEALFQHAPLLEGCINDFSKCTKTLDSATENQKAKMKLSALAGISCKDNPWTSLRLIWKSAHNPIPIESPCFKEVSTFVTAFTAQILQLSGQ